MDEPTGTVHRTAEQSSTPPGPGQRPVLVTGAFGLVGSTVVRALASNGYQVIASDLDIPANRRAAERLPHERIRVCWADLTVPGQVDDLVLTTDPVAVIHLAAIIPPGCYRQRRLARAVNVTATGSLLAAAAKMSAPPRFVLASSVAVYGPRNPHLHNDLLTPETPLAPIDLYGAHKAEAEELVRGSGLPWLILRLGGVLTVEQKFIMDADVLYFEASLPADGRIQTVDVRDVARAMTSAVSTPVTGEVFLIGGDDTHRLLQREIGVRIGAAMGLGNSIPPGRPGDPGSDTDWFATDWMDTTRSQQVLAFQQISFPSLLEEMRYRTGLLRYPLRLCAPIIGRYLARTSPYRGDPNAFASPWQSVRTHFGDPEPDRP